MTLLPCWKCGGTDAFVAQRAQGHNSWFVKCPRCFEHTRDFVGFGAKLTAIAAWNEAAERKAAAGLRARERQIVRETRERLVDDRTFIEAVVGRFVRYGKLAGQKNHGYVLRAPVDGVEHEVNAVAFADWLLPQFEAMEAFKYPVDPVYAVLHDAGLGLGERGPRTGNGGMHPRAKGPVVGDAIPPLTLAGQAQAFADLIDAKILFEATSGDVPPWERDAA